jgi:hypothetical protein
VTEERGVSDDGDAFFRTRIKPFEEFDGAFAAMFVRFALVAVEDVLIVYYFGEVIVWKSDGMIERFHDLQMSILWHCQEII